MTRLLPHFLPLLPLFWCLLPFIFNLAVFMREVSCVGYTLRAWGPFSLQSMLDGPLYFGAKWLNGRSVATDRPQNKINYKIIIDLPCLYQQARSYDRVYTKYKNCPPIRELNTNRISIELILRDYDSLKGRLPTWCWKQVGDR